MVTHPGQNMVKRLSWGSTLTRGRLNLLKTEREEGKCCLVKPSKMFVHIILNQNLLNKFIKNISAKRFLYLVVYPLIILFTYFTLHRNITSPILQTLDNIMGIPLTSFTDKLTDPLSMGFYIST